MYKTCEIKIIINPNTQRESQMTFWDIFFQSFSLARANFKDMGPVQSHRTHVQKSPLLVIRLDYCCIGIINKL